MSLWWYSCRVFRLCDPGHVWALQAGGFTWEVVAPQLPWEEDIFMGGGPYTEWGIKRMGDVQIVRCLRVT